MSDPLLRKSGSGNKARQPYVSPRMKRYAEISASPYYEAMSEDRRECVRFMRDDLYRLDDVKLRRDGEVERPDYDSLETWRYVNPPRSLFVTLTYGERNLTGHVERADGSLVSATGHATVEWLDEVLP